MSRTPNIVLMAAATFCTPEFFGLIALLIVMGVVVIYQAIRRFKLTIFVRHFYPYRSHHSGKHPVLSKGVICPTNPLELHIAPLSRRTCVFYELVILEFRLDPKRKDIVLHRESRGRENLSVQTIFETVQLKPHEVEFTNIHYWDRQDMFRQFLYPRSLSLLTQKGINPKILGT